MESGGWSFRRIPILCTARERPRLPLRREVDFCAFRRKKTEGERTRGCCLHQGVDVRQIIQVSLLFSVRLHLLLSHTLDVSLPQSSPLNPERLDSFAPSPFSARASAIRSRTCGRQRLAFLAVSATGGARYASLLRGRRGGSAAHRRFGFAALRRCAAPSPKNYSSTYTST